MGHQLFVVALIFVVMINMVMAEVAPSASPKSSPQLESAPKAAISIPSAATSISSAPSSSPKASPVTPPLAPPTSDNEEDISAPPAQASDPIELYAPGPEPVDDDFSPEESPAADEATSGASAIQFLVVASTIVFVSFFAI